MKITAKPTAAKCARKRQMEKGIKHKQPVFIKGQLKTIEKRTKPIRENRYLNQMRERLPHICVN